MPATTPAPVPALGEATVPLTSFIRPAHRHYFTRCAERPNYRLRRYDFAGTPAIMPLVRAFLDTCAAARSADYRYLFTLLGSELANNAIRHSLSGQPGGTYTLLVHRHRTGLHLACRDRGGLHDRDARLEPDPDGLNLSAESGRGLALVDTFATEWGDNGNAHYRTVWFYLAYDLTGSRWNADNRDG
ncbi:ATP-binding protein [Glycomyces fuscus]|nr:ATP-binding protein [Glycomyces fuscus]